MSICVIYIHKSTHYYTLMTHRVLCSYAASVGAQHFHTSAKSNKGLEEVFNDISTSE